MRHMLFVEMDNGYEPCRNLYADIPKETSKFARILLASSSICMGGPRPIFFFYFGYLNSAKFTKVYGW